MPVLSDAKNMNISVVIRSKISAGTLLHIVTVPELNTVLHSSLASLEKALPSHRRFVVLWGLSLGGNLQLTGWRCRAVTDDGETVAPPPFGSKAGTLRRGMNAIVVDSFICLLQC